MINWWKTATIHNFEDRNIALDRIGDLMKIYESLRRMEKLVFHTASGTRSMLHGIMKYKVLGDIPDINDILSEADSICMDSPRKFAALMMVARDKVYQKNSSIRVDMDEFSRPSGKGQGKHKWKGWHYSE